MSYRHVFAIIFLTFASTCSSMGQESSPTTKQKRVGERYAFLVGVQQYDKGSGLRPLTYTNNDVTELAELLHQSGYRPENIVLMTDATQKNNARMMPERDKVMRELSILLRDRSEADSVLIAFAGHGLHFADGDDSYFCPLDARLDNRNTLISMRSVYSQLEKCKAQTKYMFSDACRNNPMLPAARGLQLVDDENRRPIAPPHGIAAFFSCSEGEAAYEDSGLRHGVFFNFIIGGLLGDADIDEDGAIVLPELELYAKQRVADYVRNQFGGSHQMPHLEGSTRGLIVLMRSSDLATPKPLVFSKDYRNKGRAVVVNSIGMKVVNISGGDGWMGYGEAMRGSRPTASGPFHPIYIGKPYYIGTHEVTQEQFERVMRVNPSHFKESAEQQSGRLRLPVEAVSWHEAVEFCKRLTAMKEEQQAGRTYRLPSEAEWEFACRGLTADSKVARRLRRAVADGASDVTQIPQHVLSQCEFYFGGDDLSLDEHAWYIDTSFAQPHPVESKARNPFGLYDVYGNVREWCADWYGQSYIEAHAEGLREAIREEKGFHDIIQAEFFRGIITRKPSDYYYARGVRNAYPFSSTHPLSGAAIKGHGHFNVVFDPKGPTDDLVSKMRGTFPHWGHRVVRGGSWSDDYKNCRSDSRTHLDPTHKDKFTGFRVVLELAVDGVGRDKD